jgi:hypothetical protein
LHGKVRRGDEIEADFLGCPGIVRLAGELNVASAGEPGAVSWVRLPSSRALVGRSPWMSYMRLK